MFKLHEVLYKRIEIKKDEISNDEHVNKFINSKSLECKNIS
jgi:hypothetical protein